MAPPWYKRGDSNAFDVPNLVAEVGSSHLLGKAVAGARAPFTDLRHVPKILSHMTNFLASIRGEPFISTTLTKVRRRPEP